MKVALGNTPTRQQSTELRARSWQKRSQEINKKANEIGFAQLQHMFRGGRVNETKRNEMKMDEWAKGSGQERPTNGRRAL